MLIFRPTIFLICLTVILISCGQGVSTAIPQDKLFITLPAKDSLIAVDPVNETEIFRLKIGKLPHNMRQNADGSRIYVVLVGSQAIAEIDSASGELLQTFLTDPTPMTNADATPIQPHVSQQADLHRSCFDCHNGQADSAKPAIVGSRPFGLVVNQDKELIVANMLSAKVNYISLASGEISKSLVIEPSGDAHEPTELAILGNRLYVTVRPTLPSLSPSVLRAYDLDSGALLGEVDVGSAVTSLQVDTNENVIYTTNFESNTLDKFGADLERIDSFTVENGPLGINLSKDNLLVANYYNNSISKITLVGKQILSRSLQADEQQFANPTHISRSWNNENIYLISGGTKGYLLTLDIGNLAIIASMTIDGLPFDIMTTRN